MARTARVERLDWSALGFSRIFRSFSIAAHPPKLLMALLLVLALYLLGRLMDLGGGAYYPNEFANYQRLSMREFGTWRANQNEASSGIFAAALELELDAFQRMVAAASALNLGVQEGLDPSRHDPHSVVGGLREMLVSIAAWLLDVHPWFTTVYALAALGIWSLLGGAICRMAAMHAARGVTVPAVQAVQFATERWHWFFLAPLLPVAAILLVGLGLALGGIVLLNWPVLDVVGGLFFGVALAAGVLIAVMLVGLVAGVHLLGPAIAVESTDAFEAVGRAMQYVLWRPWRWLWYTGLSLVYGALTYLFVGLVVFLTLGVTRYFLGWWMTRSVGIGHRPWLDAALPVPVVGQFHYAIDWPALGSSGTWAAGLMAVWVYGLMGVLVAYAISFYIAAQTNIYLLLRQSVDDTPFEEVYEEDGAMDGAAAGAAGGHAAGAAMAENSGPQGE